MDRSQVDDVESHVGDGGQPLRGLGEGGAPGRVGTGRAGEHLVPGGEAGRGAVDDDLQLPGIESPAAPRAGAPHRGLDLRRQEQAHGRRLTPFPVDRGDRRLQQLTVVCCCTRQRLGEDGTPFEQLEGNVLPGFELFLDLVPPGRPAVGEGLDGVDVAGVVGQEHLAGPAVVLDQPHLRFLPVLVTGAPVLDDGGDLVVAVLEDVGGDLEDVAHDPLDRVAAGVDLRLHALDDDAAGRFDDIWQGHGRRRLELRSGHRSSSPERA